MADLKLVTLIAIVALVGKVHAQASPYGQCGGIGWTGATTCTSGWTCVYSNDWYSQCLQGTTTTTTSSKTSTTTTSTKATTTSTTSKTSTTSTTSKGTTTSTTTTSKTSTSTSSAASATMSGAGPSHQVAKTPVLGWNSWNAYGGDINEAKVLAAATNMSSLGLKAAGYTYVNIDDCWSNITGRDPATSALRPDNNKFPNGIQYVATAVHALGLKFGLYSDAGLTTCAGYPGSLYYETIDAQTWSSWGVDMVKYDNCNVPSNWTDSYNIPTGYDWYNSNSALRYRRLTDALNTVSRPIVYSICNWGNANVWTWGGRVGHSWRLTSDASPSWSFITGSITQASYYIQYVDFYAHGDMDMMEIGNGGLTSTEERTHFAAWCFLKSPILLGTNLGALTAAQIAVITNKELLAFSQDTTVGKAAVPYGTATNPPAYFSGSSSAGAHAFAINYGSSTTSMAFNFSDIPELASKSSWLVHDMWTGKDIGTYSGSYTASVASHDTAALRFT